MKKYIILSLAGVAALLSSCIVDPYGPGAYGPYGEPYFVSGGLNYYSYGGRYYYVDHGRRSYVDHLPRGGHYGPGYSHPVHTTGYTTYANKTSFTGNKFQGSHGTGSNQLRGNTGTQFKGVNTVSKGQSAPAKTYKDKH